MPADPKTQSRIDQLRDAIPAKVKQFNVMLSDKEYTRLQELATTNSTTKARVLRQALDNAYGMQVGKIPTCATGMACPFPHVHMQVPAPPQPGQLEMTAPVPPVVV